MDISKLKKVIQDNKDDMTYLYIYYILTNEESLTNNILDDEKKMEFLILLIENTDLYGEKRFDLAFICGVASDYIDEIFEENMTEEDLDNLCDETLLNMN